jgi:hypothetical protein
MSNLMTSAYVSGHRALPPRIATAHCHRALPPRNKRRNSFAANQRSSVVCPNRFTSRQNPSANWQNAFASWQDCSAFRSNGSVNPPKNFANCQNYSAKPQNDSAKPKNRQKPQFSAIFTILTPNF